MIKSMTGYGRGESGSEHVTVTVELRSVNNRYLDCTVKMPRSYIFAEDAIKERIQSRVARGKVDVFITVVQSGGDAFSVTVNEDLAKAYITALEHLYCLDPAHVKPDYRATDLARFPDILVVEKQPEDQDALKGLMLEALDRALDDFDAMRCREGGRMAQDILGRAETIEEFIGREVLQNVQIDESRLLTEAAIFADKVAVDEETVRLRSHLSQLRELLGRGGPIGRKLDFLIQEFNREANTIGSKCNDVENSRRVVDLKAEIEKIREQVQNLE